MTRNIPLASAAHGHHGPATPTGMLREEHEVILRALALLERFGHGIEAGQPMDREELAWLRDFFSTFADRCHHGKEEQHLFPALQRHGVPREGGPLGVMLHEHEEGRALLRAMAQGDDHRPVSGRGVAAPRLGHGRPRAPPFKLPPPLCNLPLLLKIPR